MPKTRINGQDVLDASISTNDLADDCVTADKLGIITTKGDLITFDTTGPIRFPVGVNDRLLCADNSVTGGLRWAAPGDFYNFVNGIKSTGAGTIKDIAVDFPSGGGLALDGTPQLVVRGVRQSASTPPGDYTVANGDLWYDTSDHVYKGRQQAQTLGLSWLAGDTITNSSAVANTVSETIFSNSGYAIPSGHARERRHYRLTAWGTYSTTGTPNIAFNIKCDSGNTVCGSGNQTTINNASGRNWFVRSTVTCRAAGASGQLEGLIESGVDNSSTQQRRGSVTMALNTGRTLSLAVVWGAASSSNTITCINAIWEVLN